jgi:hypothetical protein
LTSRPGVVEFRQKFKEDSSRVLASRGYRVARRSGEPQLRNLGKIRVLIAVSGGFPPREKNFKKRNSHR